MAGEEIRVTLRGDGAELGSIRASDVARLLLGMESAVAAASYAALRQPRRTGTGRHRSAVEAASRLVFQQVEPGSVVAVLSLPVLAPDDSGALDLELDDLAGAAFDRLVASAGQSSEQVDAGIARALADLGDGLGIGERFDELVISSRRNDQVLRLDSAARGYFRRLAGQPTIAQQSDVLVGSLREADFDRHTARLQTSANETVTVTFPPELDDDVHEALRGQAEFAGEVTYDPVTETARRVELRAVSTPLSLPVDADAFWAPQSIDELASAQGVAPAGLDKSLFDATEQERRDIAEALAELNG
ncbi:hypothetical protein [Modestobacter marinus]|nr:hypothetical protein [Modestobacter marinus]NIH68237.1 hypothetical protein [Modestobacter marinus]